MTVNTETTFSINIPTALIPRISAAFCAAYGYQATLPDGSANPVTPIQFTRRTIKAIIRQTVISHETNQARITAAATIESEIDLG